MCTCDSSVMSIYMILIIMILIIENKELVATAYVTRADASSHSGCRRSRLARCRAVMLQCQSPQVVGKEQEDEQMNEQSREDTPQKPDCRSSPEQMNSHMAPDSEACSLCSCGRRNRTRMTESGITAAWRCCGYMLSSLFSLVNRRKSAPFMQRQKEDEAEELGA